MKKYRIGVIGLGARGETFAVQLNEGLPRAELSALCDLDEDRIEKFTDYCGIDRKKVPTYTDPKEFFARDDMDAVMITTPDFAHLEPAIMAFEAGKHVYLDKPLEVTSERCREIIRAHRKSKVTAVVGFNMRAGSGYRKAREICASGQLGQMIHIEGLEQTAAVHGASFHRRFHRHVARSGGWLNTKCSHDMDMLQWFVGHEHRVVKVASFGGLNILRPELAPKGAGTHCHLCPREIIEACPYRDGPGLVFPVGGKAPIHHRDTATYGGDLCVYNTDKDLFDNQTLILEWENGIRGNFNLQGFQLHGKRETKIWFEKGLLTLGIGEGMKIYRSDNGQTQTTEFQRIAGGHGGTDSKMIGMFLDAIEAGGQSDSGLLPGLAATLVAEKALESALKGQAVTIDPKEYEA